jgi:hypothetical protein
VVPIAYGRPGQKLIDDAKNGKVFLGGCAMSHEENYCKTCQLKF